MATAQSVVERYINVMNSGNIDELEKFIAPDFQQLFYGFPAVQGLEGARGYVTMLRTAYPDLEQRIDAILADEGKVAFRGTLRGTSWTIARFAADWQPHRDALPDLCRSGRRQIDTHLDCTRQS